MICNQMTAPKIKKSYRIELAKTLSQHWYGVWQKNKRGEKFLGYFPSATTILNAYPQSAHLTKWIADSGWNESQQIKSAAGERGTAVHKGIELLLGGIELVEGQFVKDLNRSLSLEEWWKLSTFVTWFKEYQPEIIVVEQSVFSKIGGYAGRVDCIAKLGGQTYVLDWKTSGSIHENFPLQFAAYAKAIEENTDFKIDSTAAVQLGAQNKNGYRFVVYPEWRDHYKVFENVRAVWQYDNFDSKKKLKEPPVLDLPPTLKL